MRWPIPAMMRPSVCGFGLGPAVLVSRSLDIRGKAALPSLLLR